MQNYRWNCWIPNHSWNCRGPPAGAVQPLLARRRSGGVGGLFTSPLIPQQLPGPLQFLHGIGEQVFFFE